MLVNNQWQYKYMSEDLVVDIPLPWDIETTNDHFFYKDLWTKC